MSRQKLHKRIFQCTILLLLNLWVFSGAYALTIEKSPNDLRVFEYVQLENGLKAIVVQDPKAIKAACSLEINVGSHQEGDKYPGLAHFLEHMLFLGTEKFPNPGEFQTLIKHHGGVFNAFTAGDRTHYFFDVQTPYFKEVMERFSDFFRAPLLDPKWMDKERKNVDSEYRMYLNQDAWRLMDVTRQTSNPKHPFYRFNVGNVDTLPADKDGLHKALVSFFKSYYSPDRMTLAIVGPEPIAEQVKMVKHYFGALKQKATPTDSKIAIFTPKELEKDIQVQAQGNERTLTLDFAMPTFEKHYQEQPLVLITQWLGYEGKGSLYAALKNKGWITRLSASTEPKLGIQDLIELEFALTPEGLHHLDEITQYTFAAIHLIEEKGYPKTFFKDIQAANHLQFTYYEREDETSLASLLAHRLQWYPPEKAITSAYLMPEVTFEQAQKPLKEALSWMTQQNMRRVLLSQTVQGKQKSTWFHAPFTIAPLSLSKTPVEAVKLLSLPEPNPYIPENLTLEQGHQVKEAQQPNLIVDEKNFKLWHQHDSDFTYPKADLFINIANTMANDSPEHAVLTALFAALVTEQLNQTLYPAMMLGENIGFYRNDRGLTIQVSGYSDKQGKVLETLMTSLKDYQIIQADFDQIKERKIREYKNYDQLPIFQQAFQGLLALYTSPSWFVTELQAALEKVTPEQVQAFKDQLFSKIQIEMLVNGNYSAKEALNLGKLVKRHFNLNQDLTTVRPLEAIQWPLEKTYAKTLKATDQNHALVLYLQSSVANNSEIAKVILLSKLISTPLYQSLRSEQQIGYVVGVTMSVLQKTSGLIFFIQSPTYDPTKIYEALETFWEKFANDLKAFETSEIESVKEALVKELQDPPKTLSEQSSQFWSQIESGEFDFKKRLEIAQAVEKLTLSELLDYYQDQILESKSNKLAVVSAVDTLPKGWTLLDSWQTLKNLPEITLVSEDGS